MVRIVLKGAPQDRRGPRLARLYRPCPISFTPGEAHYVSVGGALRDATHFADAIDALRHLS